MNYTYTTIVSQSSGLYKEKGSKFLSYAIPVKNVEQAKEIIQQYKTQFYDARHVCYAYMIGSERELYRSNDDGEPSGTAGKPILGQINSMGLTDVIVIVVRYFGGVLLGTGGLIVAYREAAADALRNAALVEIEVKVEVKLTFEYILLNDVMSVCKQINVEIIDQQFDNECMLKIKIPKAIEETALGRLTKILGLRIDS
jgi:uncharacterized YigZ family protein